MLEDCASQHEWSMSNIEKKEAENYKRKKCIDTNFFCLICKILQLL